MISHPTPFEIHSHHARPGSGGGVDQNHIVLHLHEEHAVWEVADNMEVLHMGATMKRHWQNMYQTVFGSEPVPRNGNLSSTSRINTQASKRSQWSWEC